jgi:L-ascorbate metabolism protein UlaG (beta-lactamase superfamily)
MKKTNSQSVTSFITLKMGKQGKKRKRVMSILIYTFIAIIGLGIVAFSYLQQPQFVSPIVKKKSYNGKFYNGVFHNATNVPIVTAEENPIIGLYRFITEKQLDDIPRLTLPSIKTDLHNLDIGEDIIVWMGHSSYYIQLDGHKILIDPVFSDNASPIPHTNEAFQGSNIYTAEDIPDIDYLLITHDHWDHFDYPTINALRKKINKIVTPINVGSYFIKWGFNESQISEGDWFSSIIQGDLNIYILPAQHFSGRLFKRNKTLWGSFALVTPQHKIYLGGDSGYGPHFKEISEKLGVFDIAILESGQYNQDWPYIHMMPEETAQAAVDLKAKALIPSHNSKFKLARHSWYEPLDRITKASENKPYRLLTPIIGEKVLVDDTNQMFTSWWKNNVSY